MIQIKPNRYLLIYFQWEIIHYIIYAFIFPFKILFYLFIPFFEMLQNNRIDQKKGKLYELIIFSQIKVICHRYY